MRSSMTSSWTPTPAFFRWLLLAALIPFAAVVWIRWAEPPTALDGDYAHYLLHAKAIAEGRPYSDIGYIYTSMNLVGPRLQPPGWPLVLAPFVAVFGTDSPVFKLLVTVLVAAFSVIAGLYTARRSGAVAGIAVVAFLPLALETHRATGSALSDPLFLVLVWLSMLVADDDGPPDWRRGIVLALLSAATMSVRVAGIALPPALMLHALVKWRKDALKVVLPIGALFGVAAVGALLAVDNIPFLSLALSNTPGVSGLINRFGNTYKQSLATSALYPLWSNSGNDVYHLLIAVPLLVGAVLFVRHQLKSAVASFVLMYFCVLLLSPVRDARYAWPMYPLVAAWIASGLVWLGERFTRPARRPMVPRFVLGFVAVVSIGAAVQLSRAREFRSLLGDPDTVSLFNWLKATADTSNLRVVFTNPRVLTLETGIPAMGMPGIEPDQMVAEFDAKSITHVVVPLAHITRRSERALGALVAARPAQFPMVFSNASHEVHRFVARPEAPADSGALRSPLPQ
jgi:hypothetical protein